MNFLILENYPYIQVEHLKYLEEKGHKLINHDDIYKNSDIDALIINIKKIDVNILNIYPNLKYICRTGVGLDMVDLVECKNRNIEVVNTPGANADSVADITIWGIIGLLRKTYLEFEGLDDSFNFLGKEVGKNTVGIFGFGMIGKMIYNRLKAFGVTNFLIYDPYLSEENIKKYEYCQKSEDKNFILKNSDIISLNLPLTKETFHFMGEEQFKIIKNDVVIANTARGAIIDELYLIEFLKNNKQAGAYLDVWENEPEKPHNELKKLINCVITPHIGAMTESAYKKMHEFKI